MFLSSRTKGVWVAMAVIGVLAFCTFGALARPVGKQEATAAVKGRVKLPACRDARVGAPSVDHFAWNAIGSPQLKGVPFGTTIVAKDAFGATFTGFTGTVNLSGWQMATIFQANFEGWDSSFEIDNDTYGDGNGLWHWSSGRASDPGHSGPWSFYFGTGEGPSGGGTYDTGLTVSGALYSPILILYNVSAPITLSFKYLLETEGEPGDYDRAAVEYTTDGSNWYAVASNWYEGLPLVDPTNGKWLSASVDLSFLAGYVFQIRFVFDTYDNEANDYEGWYVDDVAIKGAMPVPISPAASSSFVSGVWKGNVTVLDAAPEVFLRADDGGGHSGDSNTFTVAALVRFYKMDGFGGVHPAGGAPSFSGGPYWPGWDVAKDLAVVSDWTGAVQGYYVLDRLGGVHKVGSVSSFTGGPYFGFDIARAVKVVYDVWGDVQGYYVLDGFGGVHKVGSVSSFSGGPYWPGWDIAKDMDVVFDGGGTVYGYYVLDGFGGIHKVGSVPAMAGSPYFGFNIARALKVVYDMSGNVKGYYVLDGFGGVHRAGNVPAFSGGPYWPGWDIAKDLDVVFDHNGNVKGYYILDGLGGVHPVGNVLYPQQNPHWGWDIARAICLVREWQGQSDAALKAAAAESAAGAGAPAEKEEESE